MGRKYIEDLGIDITKTPYGWSNGDKRQEGWNKEKEIYGFDNRETWSLDTTFFYWLYERLMMFNEVNCINTDFHTFNIRGEILTLQQCIDRMIFGCKYYITSNNSDAIIVVAEEVVGIWKECMLSMWW